MKQIGTATNQKTENDFKIKSKSITKIEIDISNKLSDDIVDGICKGLDELTEESFFKPNHFFEDKVTGLLKSFDYESKCPIHIAPMYRATKMIFNSKRLPNSISDGPELITSIFRGIRSIGNVYGLDDENFLKVRDATYNMLERCFTSPYVLMGSLYGSVTVTSKARNFDIFNDYLKRSQNKIGGIHRVFEEAKDMVFFGGGSGNFRDESFLNFINLTGGVFTTVTLKAFEESPWLLNQFEKFLKGNPYETFSSILELNGIIEKILGDISMKNTNSVVDALKSKPDIFIKWSDTAPGSSILKVKFLKEFLGQDIFEPIIKTLNLNGKK